MADDFAHLHLHTQFSLLDGAIRMKDLCTKVRERGMTSVAVTDHGNMHGAIQLYQRAKEAGVKPIFGCEAYLADGDAEARSDRKNYHIVLLARNNVGFANLQRLVSYGHIQGFYYQPRIDRKILRKHSEGLIALSACLGGHISRLVNANELDKAKQTVLEYKSIFEPDSYFLELQANGMALQESTNATLAQLGADTGVPLVATNDCHYVDQREAKAHEVLMCMGMQRTMKDPGRISHEHRELYIKSPDEMWGYFSRYPEAMENARRIPALCNVELRLGQTDMPRFDLPADVEEDLPGYLTRLAREGLDRRLAEFKLHGQEVQPDRYRERLEYEIQMIIRMGFPGYFLIVWDFIREAKDRGIPVGPGRGSGAGSLVAYALRITDVDPIRWGLLFERFLNPERVSLPDFDVDFCMDRRGEAIDYVTQRYGHDRVGQITTLATLKARGLVRDVARALGHAPAVGNEVAQLVPEGPKVTLSGIMRDPKALQAEARQHPEQASKYEEKIKLAESGTKLRDKCRQDPGVQEIVELGLSLEGLNRHAGVHAAGIVIGNEPLIDLVPCCKSEDGRLTTQFDMVDVETAGLIKFDFLGLTTLTVIQRTLDQIARLPDHLRMDPVSRGAELDLASMPVDDPLVYEMLSRGDTTGVFQLESSGFKNLLQRLKPDRFEDIIAIVALYRPGPLEGGMVDQYVACKHGRRQIQYPHPLLESILRKTYGVFVFQEQVIEAVQVLAGFSAGGADILRRAMGKKKPKEMEEQRDKFIAGCAKVNKIPHQLSSEIFGLIDKFSGYGFNASHACAYGMISYQTAFLKLYYPECFMAALMSCAKDTESIVKHIDEARSCEIKVLPPDINQSIGDFGVVCGDGRPSIRFALAAIRDVGGAAASEVVTKRTSPYTSIFDLCARVGPAVNKRSLEALIRAGALDSIAEGHDRGHLLAAVPGAITRGQQEKKSKDMGQGSIFDAMPDLLTRENVYPHALPTSAKERLQWERDALGLYLTDHPLDRYAGMASRMATCPIAALGKQHLGREVRVLALVSAIKERSTRKQEAMASLMLEDRSGKIEAVAFPRSWSSIAETATAIGPAPVLAIGRLQTRTDEGGEVKIDLLELRKLPEPDAHIEQPASTPLRRAVISVSHDDLTDDRIDRLLRLISHSKGTDEFRVIVVVEESGYQAEIVGAHLVNVDDGFQMAIERLFTSKLVVREIGL